MRLYQIGGFRSHTNRWQRSPLKEYFLYSNDLSRTLFPPDTPPPPCLRNSEGNLEMILGITKIGSSYLLLDETRFQDLLRHLNIPRQDWPRDKPYHSDEFISLSPITFVSHTALNAKLHSLQPKANKKKNIGGDVRDVSRANERFGLENNRDVAISIGRLRADFELCRTIFQATHQKKSLHPYVQGPWDGNVLGILTFAFTAWPGKPPVPLDAGWAKISVAALPDKIDVKGVAYYETAHLKDTSKSLLIQKDDRYCKGEVSTFSHGETSLVSSTDLGLQVKQLFTDIEGRHQVVPNEPALLLLHDAKTCLDILRSFGVDTSTWGTADDLVYGDVPADTRRPSREPGPVRLRDGRSRSPNYRETSIKSEADSSHRERARSGPSTSLPARQSDDRRLFYSPTPTPGPTPQPMKPSLRPIYYIDIQRLFNAILERNDRPTFREVCAKLGICDADQGWCAGNDARYLYEAWKILSGGSTIDDRTKEYLEERDHRAEVARRIKNEAYRSSKTPMRTSDTKNVTKSPPLPKNASTRFDPLSGAEAPGLHGASVPQQTSNGTPARDQVFARTSNARGQPTSLADDWEAISDEEDGIPSDDSD